MIRPVNASRPHAVGRGEIQGVPDNRVAQQTVPDGADQSKAASARHHPGEIQTGNFELAALSARELRLDGGRGEHDNARPRQPADTPSNKLHLVWKDAEN